MNGRLMTAPGSGAKARAEGRRWSTAPVPLRVVMAHSNRLEDVNSPRSKVASISVTDLLNAPSAVALLQPIATEGSVTLPDRDGLPDEVWRLGRGDRRSPGGGPGLRPRRSSIAAAPSSWSTGSRQVRRGRRGTSANGREAWSPTSPSRGGSTRSRLPPTGLEVGLAVANAAVSYVGPLPGPEPGEPGRHGAGELPRDHRAGRVGPAADGGAWSRGLHRHQLRLGAGGHGRRRELQRQQGLRAQPGRGDRLGAARARASCARPSWRPRWTRRAGARTRSTRPGCSNRSRSLEWSSRPRSTSSQQEAGSWPTPGWSSWRGWIGGLASSSCRASPARSTPTATRSPSGRRRTPWRPRRWHRDRRASRKPTSSAASALSVT